MSGNSAQYGGRIKTTTAQSVSVEDQNSPIGLEPFLNGGRINMGAYGGTEEARKSYFGKPVCKIIVAGDINGDCKVDFKDLAMFLQSWLECNLVDESGRWEWIKVV